MPRILWSPMNRPYTDTTPVVDKYTPFFFKNRYNGENTLRVLTLGEPPDFQVEYSFDNSTWRTAENTTASGNISIAFSDKIYLRAKTERWAVDSMNHLSIHAVYDVDAAGNIMSLLYGNEFTGNETTFKGSGRYELCGLFSMPLNHGGWLNPIIDASKVFLPATTLHAYSYCEMFAITNISTPPSILPADNLRTGCYYFMFNYCPSLTETPILPSKTLAMECYNNMFAECAKLKKVTCLATDISASNCTGYWLRGVSSTGEFIKDKNMNSWEIDTFRGIPDNWTIKDYEEPVVAI